MGSVGSREIAQKAVGLGVRGMAHACTPRECHGCQTVTAGVGDDQEGGKMRRKLPGQSHTQCIKKKPSAGGLSSAAGRVPPTSSCWEARLQRAHMVRHGGC